MSGPIALFFSSRRGGVQRGSVVLANALSDRGLDVLCIMPKLGGPFLCELAPSVKQISLDTQSQFVAAMRLAGVLHKERPCDVIASDTFGVNTAVLARALTNFHRLGAGLTQTGTRIVGVQHQILSELCCQTRSHKKRAMMPRLVRVLYPMADRLIAVSQAAAIDLAKMTGVRVSDIAIIPSTTITPQIAKSAMEPTGKPWLDRECTPVILAVGDLRAVKDYETLIRAFAFLRTNVRAHLVILGEGDERPKLEALARDLGVDHDVDMVGHVVNPYAYMARADLLVLSSRHEGFGNVLIEAMACGCPVVSTDCYGPREVLDNGRYGQLVPIGDPCRMAAAISHALTRDVDRTSLQRRSAEFGIDQIVNRYIDLLRDDGARMRQAA